jgi:hypothetical protein
MRPPIKKKKNIIYIEMCLIPILGLIVVYIIYNLVTADIEITCVIEKEEKKKEIEDKTMLDELLAKKET